MLSRVLRWLRTQDDPAPLQPGEDVRLRGPTGFGRAGSGLASGTLVLTTKRLWFKPRAPRFIPLSPKPVEIPLDSITSLTQTGNRSISDPFPGLQRVSLKLKSGEEYVFQTFHEQEWIRCVESLAGLSRVLKKLL